MPSTHVSLYVHLVFSTKERHRWIKDSWEERLHSYIGGILRNIGGVADKIGGDLDHVHILASLKPTHCIAYVLRDLKASSSAWVHREIGIPDFEWQDGYGAYSVSSSALGGLRKYIAQQKMHHRIKTFQEEYLELLRENGIEFDERYLWQPHPFLSPLQGSWAATSEPGVRKKRCPVTNI
jgi:putative transposase